MLSKETLEMYRRMTPGQRLALTLQAMRYSIPQLLQGPEEIVRRRFELIRRRNDERNRNMLERLAAAEEARLSNEEELATESDPCRYTTGPE